MNVHHIRRFFIGLALMASAAAAAQTISWKDISGPPTCAIVKHGLNGRFYAATSGTLPDGSISYGGKLLFSIDSGRSWKPTSLTYGYFREVVVRGPRIVVLREIQSTQTPLQALLSTNDGESWKGILSAGFAAAITGMMISSAGEIYGLWRDFRFGPAEFILARYTGSRWITLGNALRFYGDYVTTAAMDSCGNVYFGTNESGLYVSIDTGISWRQTLPSRSISYLQAGACGTVIAGITPNPVATGGVFTSADTGHTWTLLGLAHNRMTAVTTDASRTFYASTDAGTYRYLGVPLAWQALGPFTGLVDDLAASDAGVLVAVSETRGIFRSADSGRSWSKSDLRGQDISAIVSPEPGVLFAGTYGRGVFTSQDAGESWMQLQLDAVGEYVYALERAGSSVYAATERGLYRTTDRAFTWINLTAAAFSGGVFSCLNSAPDRLFAGSNFGVHRSEDQGSSWAVVLETSVPVTVLAGDGQGGSVLASAADGPTYLSTDGGASWRGLQLPRDGVQSALITPGGRLVLGVSGGVIVSSDAGSSWLLNAFSSTPVYALVRLGSTIAAGTGDGVYISSDEGENWERASSGMYEPRVIAVAVGDSSHLLAGTFQGGLYESIQAITAAGEEVSIPRASRLLASYPNPFNPRTLLKFELSSLQRVTLRIYDTLGREVTTLVDGPAPAGAYEIPWEAGGMPSGLYLARLSAGAYQGVLKLLLVK